MGHEWATNPGSPATHGFQKKSLAQLGWPVLAITSLHFKLRGKHVGQLGPIAIAAANHLQNSCPVDSNELETPTDEI